MTVKKDIVWVLTLVVLVSLFSQPAYTFKLPATLSGLDKGIVGKIKDLFNKLTGDGIQASCSAIPSVLDRVVPACLKCEDGTWKIKSGIGGVGLLKCRKSRKSEKEGEKGEKGGKNGAGQMRGSLGLGHGTVMLLLTILFVGGR